MNKERGIRDYQRVEMKWEKKRERRARRGEPASLKGFHIPSHQDDIHA